MNLENIGTILMFCFGGGGIFSWYLTYRSNKSKSYIDLLDRAYKEIEKLDTKIEKLEQELEESHTENEKLKSIIDELKRSLNELKLELAKATGEKYIERNGN